jgi:aspartate carbamoyltransferase catalytic subunit
VLSINNIDAIYLAGMENPEHPSPENHILTREILERAGSSVRVFHPLPRGNELPAEIDQMPQAAYFRQAANGVPVRMAILERTLLWT